ELRPANQVRQHRFPGSVQRYLAWIPPLTHSEEDSPKNELPATRGSQILPFAQESATNQTARGKQAYGLVRSGSGYFRIVIALLWPWARNCPHLDAVVGAVVDVKALWSGDPLHFGTSLLAASRCDSGPRS